MPLSNELQLGKAGEHLVCADLILKGYSAFLADQGLPYDVIGDIKGRLYKIQVRSTSKLISTKKTMNMYRFGLRSTKHSRKIKAGEIDYFAFVALDIKVIAYIKAETLLSEINQGCFKQVIEFKSPFIDYPGRVYSNGTIRKGTWAKFINEFGEIR